MKKAIAKDKNIKNQCPDWLTNLHGKCPKCQSRQYREIIGANLDKECVECGTAYK